MLVLTRKEGESIVLYLPDGGEVKIRLFKCNNSQVSIGLNAPSEIDIIREELLEIASESSS